jgi:patatin-like phospholipase/acyl hydrolase
MSKKIKILSIDGGGIRGLMPATILQYMEHQIQLKTNNPFASLYEYFDFFAGTSTGGILISTYLYPTEKNNLLRNKYSSTDALNMYKHKGASIFSNDWIGKLSSFGGLWKSRYSASHLEKYLYLFFKETKISQLLKPSLITSYDIERKQFMYFQSHKAKLDSSLDFLLRDACRASSSAPTYFDPISILSQTNESYGLIDGSVIANNPSLIAITEAMAWYNVLLNDIELYSFGTGKNAQSYTIETIKDWGGLGWLNPILDILMNGVSESNERQLEVLFSMLQISKQYHRIQPQMIEASQEMDEVSIENIEALIRDAETYIRQNQLSLDHIVDHLIQNK